MTNEEGNKRYSEQVAEIEAALSALRLDKSKPYGKLYEAMEYSLLAGGKRLRPLMLIEFSRLFGGRTADAMPFACAVEMIHTYSLIHDDLPCMDDDDLRRGRPTSHKVFGEAGALLAGDALLNRAYELMLEACLNLYDPARGVEAALMIADSAGADGMIGGQTLDLENEVVPPDEDRLALTDRLKTGALFGAACVAGAVLGGAREKEIAAARTYAELLGHAFQIVDDILDVTSSEEELGKPIGSDAASGKKTYVDFYSVEGCRKLAENLTEQAVDAISGFEGSDFLAWLARSLLLRIK